jgi:DNA-binding NarL/FixJ family response regulator
MTRIVLADDHELVRESLLAILSQHQGLDVVGVAADGTTALALIQEHEPDLAILDQSIPMLVGIDVILEASKLELGTRFLLLTMHSEPYLARQAFHAGAHGVVLKDDAVAALLDGIGEVLDGRFYSSPSLTREGQPSQEPLTSREREILLWIARGLSNSAIADELEISPRTVDTHRTRLMRKLGKHTVAELVSFAVRSGLVDR